MLHFDVKILHFMAIFIFKIAENCYNSCFLAAMAWKNVVSVVRTLVTNF